MSSLLTAELLKQRTTRLVPVTLAAALGMALFVLSEVITNAGVRGAPSLGTTAHTRQILGVPVLATLPFLVLGVTSVTAEHRHRTIIPTVLAEPRRHRIVGAKVVVCAAVALVWALIAVLMVQAVATPWLAGQGVDHLANMTPTLWTALGATLLVLPLYAVMGVGLGAVLPSPVVGAVAPLVWLLILEPNVVAPRFPAIERFLPGVATSIAGNAPHAPAADWWSGLLVLVGWAAVLVTAGLWRTRGRDL